jgi:hypothetical protein
MSCTGVYLYYGYKIREEFLRSILEPDYVIYCNSRYELTCSKINIYNNPKPCPKYAYKFDEFLFSEYVNNLFPSLGENVITITTLPCCSYKKGGYWIVGKKISHLDGCDLNPIKLSSQYELTQIDPILEKAMITTGLIKIINNDDVPSVYAIIDDCMRCT